MAVTRGGQTAEYTLYLYGKTDNDYRLPSNPDSPPMHYWARMDFGELAFPFFEKVKASIDVMLHNRGYDQFLLGADRVLYESSMYLGKYGPDIDESDINRLLPLDVANLGESGNPSLSALGVIIYGLGMYPSPPTRIVYNPEIMNIQEGIYISHPSAAPAVNNNAGSTGGFGANHAEFPEISQSQSSSPIAGSTGGFGNNNNAGSTGGFGSSASGQPRRRRSTRRARRACGTRRRRLN